jgi:hypothetical protein
MKCNKLFILIIYLSIFSRNALADAPTYWETLLANTDVAYASYHGQMLPSQEVAKINENFAHWQAGVPLIPLYNPLKINDKPIVFEYNQSNLSDNLKLTFDNQHTGGIAYYSFSVTNELSLDQLTVDYIKNNLTLIGQSNSSSNGYLFNTNINGFEPIILAALLDTNGNLINFETGGGYGMISTVSQVPVPAAAWFFGSALAGLIGFNRRKIA